VVTTREPSDGSVGRLIRAQLAGGELGDSVLPYLFAADRRDHLDRHVLPAVARGDVVLSDRYALSSLAYQAEAHGFERVWALNEAFPAPTITIMLELSPEKCLERIDKRGGERERFETLDRLKKIEGWYRVAIERARSAGWRIVSVDADRPVDEVAASVRAAVWARG
jgi:dTMP kinase